MKLRVYADEDAELIIYGCASFTSNSDVCCSGGAKNIKQCMLNVGVPEANTFGMGNLKEACFCNSDLCNGQCHSLIVWSSKLLVCGLVKSYCGQFVSAVSLV